MNADVETLRNSFPPYFLQNDDIFTGTICLYPNRSPLHSLPRCCTLTSTTMQAIQILTTGSADVLTLRDLPTPTPGPGEALIRIEASGVNFIDTYFREGRYPANLPYTLGQEASGIVESVATGVPDVKPGDRVAWCGIPGTYAEFAVAPASRLVPIPAGVSSPQAAAAILQGMTAHYLAHSTYKIQSGDEVLVHAGAGGTGLLLIQWPKLVVPASSPRFQPKKKPP